MTQTSLALSKNKWKLVWNSTFQSSAWHESRKGQTCRVPTSNPGFMFVLFCIHTYICTPQMQLDYYAQTSLSSLLCLIQVSYHTVKWSQHSECVHGNTHHSSHRRSLYKTSNCYCNLFHCQVMIITVPSNKSMQCTNEIRSMFSYLQQCKAQITNIKLCWVATQLW